MDRRDFIKLAVGGVIGAVIAPLDKSEEKTPKVIRVKADDVWYEIPMIKETDNTRNKQTTLELDADTHTLTLTNLYVEV